MFGEQVFGVPEMQSALAYLIEVIHSLYPQPQPNLWIKIPRSGVSQPRKRQGVGSAPAGWLTYPVLLNPARVVLILPQKIYLLK